MEVKAIRSAQPNMEKVNQIGKVREEAGGY